MRRTTMLWEVFVRRFEEAFEQYEKHLLSSEEAGELLGMSGRNFRRLCVRYEEDGVEGLRDRRIGKVSPRRAAARELERMHELYRERYSDFTVKHFHEQLVKRHHYKLCYTVTKASLQAAGLVAKAKRRGAHRKKRVRRSLPGMLLFQDGSTHRWIAGLGHDLESLRFPSSSLPPWLPRSHRNARGRPDLRSAAAHRYSAAMLSRVIASSSPSKRKASVRAMMTKSLSASSRAIQRYLILATNSSRGIAWAIDKWLIAL